MQIRTVFLLLLAALSLVTFCVFVESFMRFHVATALPGAYAGGGMDVLAWWLLFCVFATTTFLTWSVR